VRRLVFLCLLAVFLGANCGGSGAKPQADLNAGGGGGEVTEDELWLPESQPYKMGVGDALTVRFFYYPLYDFTALVRPDGMVTVPLLGEVKAAGIRPSELEQMIRSHFADVVAEPEVSVMVTAFGNQRVFVFGEVAEPGAYALMGDMTVVDAVVVAGGVRPAAGRNSVVLMRKSPEGHYVARKVDLDARLRGRETEIIYLAPADIVYVPVSAIGKVDRFVDQFFAKLTPAWRFYILGRDVIDPDGQTIISQ
jgi:polysaccharide export outer membrane protein